MDEKRFYALPQLPYGYDALKPYLSEEQLRLHHDKHHAAYVNAANSLLESLGKARKDNAELDFGTIAKQLAFDAAGHRLHSLFWANMRKPRDGNTPSGSIAERIGEEFGSFERFKKEFSQAALKTEGSGWATLTWCHETMRPIIVQLEKHGVNAVPKRPILMVLDVWEHAYYVDYRNDRAKYVENFWNVVDWDEVEKRLKELMD